MRLRVLVALVLVVWVGYTSVSARKRTIEDIEKQLENLENDYENKKSEILLSDKSEQDIKYALGELENVYTKNKNILTEQLNRRIKRKKKRARQRKLEQTQIDVLKRKH